MRLFILMFSAVSMFALQANAREEVEDPMTSAENSATTTSTLEADTQKANVKEDAKAYMKSSKGDDNGTVIFTDGPNGLLATIEVNGLTPGWHAIHVHEKGECAPPDFKSAGAHASSHKHKHGFLMKGGIHDGDMPNIWVRDDGVAKAQSFMPGVFLKTLVGKSGAAVTVHAKADDYSTQPSGDSGDRISCGVIEVAKKTAKRK